METTTTNAIVSGCLVWWEPKAANAAKLREALEAIGLDSFAPNAETMEAALKHALGEYGDMLAKLNGVGSQTTNVNGDKEKRKYEVKARLSAADDGFELVEVTRRKAGNGYRCEVAVKVDKKSGGLSVIDGWLQGWSVWDLQERFDEYRSQATGANVGRSLVELTKHLHGTCVRLGGGGNYYLPEDVATRWADVIDAYESCSKTRVQRMRVVMDDLAARAIRDGITAELLKEGAEVADELAKGELKEDVIERRKQRSQELRTKCRQYESILNDTLVSVHAVLDMADQCAAVAIGVQESGTVFDEAFA
jgi:hypothetical protein